MAKHIFDGAKAPKHPTQSTSPDTIQEQRQRLADNMGKATIRAAKQSPNNKSILSDLQRLIQTETAKLQANSETMTSTLGEVESKHLSRLASAAAILATADKKLNDNSALEKMPDEELEALARDALGGKGE